MYRIHMIINGLVQGVGFRMSAQLKAKELNLQGWVRNLPNGTVEIEAEGKKDNIDQFITIIKKGPSPFSKIDNVDLTFFETLQGYTSFDIK